MLPDASTVWRPQESVDVAATLGALQRGTGDPTQRWASDGALWRTARTPLGPATLRVAAGGGEVVAEAWGPGAQWVVAGLPDLLGARDDVTGFVPRHDVIRESWRRRPGLRMPRVGLVLELLVPSILEQKVTGAEARRSWRELLRRFGERAPGPAPDGMRVAPCAGGWRRIPSWEWHRAGVDAKRARTILAAAAVAPRLEEAAGMKADDALARLRAVPGVGAWTAAEVAQRAFGDPDAVSVGDFHLPALVGWALAGRPVDDGGMLALLAAYPGHRARAVRLLELSGFRKPAFGPRLPVRDFRAV